MSKVIDVEVITTCRRVVRVNIIEPNGTYKEAIDDAIKIAQEELSENRVIGVNARVLDN